MPRSSKLPSLGIKKKNQGCPAQEAYIGELEVEVLRPELWKTRGRREGLIWVSQWWTPLHGFAEGPPGANLVSEFLKEFSGW